ncbi:UDP-N-acetylglucosamine pyrophosphorylase [Actinidia chinensis var. chinensis]|uniref:UDP-N-acetylglucosamine pyrophosphorylase n=1 Tax=Actinidia chinensis var. chinensis TaxID=1590841 RepID=A0A2R6PUW6_ACTCC|nr:UDP-N-acetylglucosamine pyrophosphorylase [Actinidia chinensis var. chinensis]
MPNKEIKAKSTRKPLKDVSNGIRSSKSVKKKAPDNDDQGEDDALDRLLLAHADLASLIHQIDEIVVQALKAKVTSKNGSKEIKSFTQVLSEIQSSLKPWAPRLQKALSSHSTGSENQLGQSLASKTVPPANEDTSDAIQSPEQTKLDSLVSPSPLVSWRPDCTMEGGRQLFLLTPLPRPKAFSSKFQSSCKAVIEKITSNTTPAIQSLVAISGETDDDLLEGVEIKPAPSKVYDSLVTKRESNMEYGFVSPPKLSKRDCCVLVMTPCLKMSPPKSCVLLEPISELSHKGNHGFRKSTPFPVGILESSGSETSESSGSEVSENLALKYPELFGIQLPQKLGNGRKGVETSPDWLMSPPKTCILMEPPDEKSLVNAASNCRLPTPCVQNPTTDLLKGNDDRTDHHLARKFCSEEISCSKALIESTPLWKEPESIFRTGKRPGENTLKKELWTKFEAASTHEIHFDVSVLQETAQKGFLDRLEEVSCD